MLSNAVCALVGLVPAILAGTRPPIYPTWLDPLPKAASDTELRYQPAMHFGGSSCYNTAAISMDGFTNLGHDGTGSCPWDGCRDEEHLDNNNVYSRMRCNNGWCAIMYDYYFVKDQSVCGSFGVGHRHDWENIVVFVYDGQVVRIAPSAHGGYSGATNAPYMLGNHPAVVYNQDGGLTHCMRAGTREDEFSMHNHKGGWFLGDLVGWDFWPDETLKDALYQAFPGRVSPNFIEDEVFANKLKNAAGDECPGFDPYVDGDEEDPFDPSFYEDDDVLVVEVEP